MKLTGTHITELYYTTHEGYDGRIYTILYLPFAYCVHSFPLKYPFLPPERAKSLSPAHLVSAFAYEYHPPLLDETDPGEFYLKSANINGYPRDIYLEILEYFQSDTIADQLNDAIFAEFLEDSSTEGGNLRFEAKLRRK